MNSLRVALALLASCAVMHGALAEAAGARWYKGNLHTHSLWSDGDDYPEMVAEWYKQHGYHFLGISDHNDIQEGTRWLELNPHPPAPGAAGSRATPAALERYRQRFGSEWVEVRDTRGKTEVRLKPFAEYRRRVEQPGRFLLIPSEEISAGWRRPKTEGEPERGGPVHMNVTNPREFIAPAEGDSALSVMQQMTDAVLEQRARTGQAMIPHVNHPNFFYAITAEDLMRVRGEKFFEVYNGHPGVNNQGSDTKLDTDAMWDAILAHRLTDLRLGVMYATAVDDAHNYHHFGVGQSNAGRGWIMVRAVRLTPEAIIGAMEAGEFYASTGVVLADVTRESGELRVQVQPEAGVTYTITFIGTRRGFDPATEVLPSPAEGQGKNSLPHRRYSADIGAVFGKVEGTSGAYRLRGDEIYVRAKIVSSKSKVNGSVSGEFETAWTQPLVNAAGR